MNVKVKVNYWKFRSRMNAMQARGNNAREAFVLAMGATFVQNAVRLAPRDTNRYVRGWLEAARDAGIRTSAMPAIQHSKKRDELVAALTKQVMLSRRSLATLEYRRELWYEKTGRPKRGYYNKLINQIDRQKVRVGRAEEELQRYLKATGAVVMMRTSGAVLNGYQRMLSGDSLRATVRDKVYGGRGRLARGAKRAGLFLHNLEPHCRVVEKYRRVVARAQLALNSAGLKRLRGVYVDAMATGTRDAQRMISFGRSA